MSEKLNGLARGRWASGLGGRPLRLLSVPQNSPKGAAAPRKLSKWLLAPLSLAPSWTAQPALEPRQRGGLGGLKARFRDGRAQGHASRWAGTQEGRQPVTSLGTRGGLPARKAQLSTLRLWPARFLRVTRTPREGG